MKTMTPEEKAKAARTLAKMKQNREEEPGFFDNLLSGIVDGVDAVGDSYLSAQDSVLEGARKAIAPERWEKPKESLESRYAAYKKKKDTPEIEDVETETEVPTKSEASGLVKLIDEPGETPSKEDLDDTEDSVESMVLKASDKLALLGDNYEVRLESLNNELLAEEEKLNQGLKDAKSEARTLSMIKLAVNAAAQMYAASKGVKAALSAPLDSGDKERLQGIKEDIDNDRRILRTRINNTKSLVKDVYSQESMVVSTEEREFQRSEAADRRAEDKQDRTDEKVAAKIDREKILSDNKRLVNERMDAERAQKRRNDVSKRTETDFERFQKLKNPDQQVSELVKALTRREALLKTKDENYKMMEKSQIEEAAESMAGYDPSDWFGDWGDPDLPAQAGEIAKLLNEINELRIESPIPRAGGTPVQAPTRAPVPAPSGKRTRLENLINNPRTSPAVRRQAQEALDNL